MAGKTIDKVPMNIEQLRAKLNERLTGTPLDIPNWGVVEVAMLKNIEIQKMNETARMADGSTDASLWNRMSASFGLVSPTLSPEELAEYPSEFIIPIANKVWELTNAYAEAQAKGNGTAPVPFSKRPSLSSFSSQTDSTSSPTK